MTSEHISGMRWWRHADIAGYRGTDLFSPRDIATPLAALIAGDIPDTPVTLGLNLPGHPLLAPLYVKRLPGLVF
jgi:8-oxo-dGTP diphosphatase